MLILLTVGMLVVIAVTALAIIMTIYMKWTNYVVGTMVAPLVVVNMFAVSLAVLIVMFSKTGEERREAMKEECFEAATVISQSYKLQLYCEMNPYETLRKMRNRYPQVMKKRRS